MSQVIAEVSQKSRVLYLIENHTDRRFLVDTGAGISVLPLRPEDLKHANTSSSLTAANGSKITMYGERLMELDFGTGRKFTWKFQIAQVTCAILGVDFLHESRYLIDINQSSITDQVTNITVNAAAVKLTDSQRLSSSVLPDSPYTRLLSCYPDLTAEANATTLRHNIVHRIPRGGPVYCKPRRLHPNVAADAKLSFGKLLRDGVVSYSNSPWPSPLHTCA